MAGSRLTEDFLTEKVTIRGTEYEFQEISANEYEEIIKLTADEEGNADLNKVLKLMVIKAIRAPKLDSESLGRKPYFVYSQLLRTVNEMHFGEGPKPPKEGEAAAPNE